MDRLTLLSKSNRLSSAWVLGSVIRQGTAALAPLCFLTPGPGWWVWKDGDGVLGRLVTLVCHVEAGCWWGRLEQQQLKHIHVASRRGCWRPHAMTLGSQAREARASASESCGRGVCVNSRSWASLPLLQTCPRVVGSGLFPLELGTLPYSSFGVILNGEVEALSP